MILTWKDVPIGTKVFLNGEEVSDVDSVDTLQGTVTSLRYNSQGQSFVIHEDIFAMRVQQGRLTLKFPDPFDVS